MLPIRKKKAVTVILGSPHQEGPEEKEVPESSEALHAVAREIISAVKADSEDALVKALRAFLAEHEAVEHSEME
jgi:hypothetical protein